MRCENALQSSDLFIESMYHILDWACSFHSRHFRTLCIHQLPATLTKLST
jgi:hypothetical protein